MTDNLQVVIPLFDRCTALDAVGPYEVLQRIPLIDVTFIDHQPPFDTGSPDRADGAVMARVREYAGLRR